MMIHNIIFDMSNTLIAFESATMMRLAGVQEEDHELFRREVIHSTAWYALDRGVITQAEAVRQICEEVPARLHDGVEYILSHLFEGCEPFAYMYDLVRDCKAAGYQTFLLSNAPVRFYEFQTLIPAISLMDGMLISSDVKLLKPDPAIYRLFCEKFGVTPESCYLIDDMETNVESAMHCGMGGFVFRRDIARLREAMKRAGIRL